MTVVSASPAHRRRRALLVLAAVGMVLVVGMGLAAVQAERVHHRYGTWALRPGGHTPAIPFHGRDYDRGARLQSLPVDVEKIGSAPGNGEVFSAPPLPGISPTVLYVRYPDGSVFDYALSGGP